MEKNRKKQIVVLSIALVCIFILVFSLFHKSATKDSANPPLTNVFDDFFIYFSILSSFF